MDGRIYVMDYDRDKKQDLLRCLSLADAQLIWSHGYPVSVKRNHGMSRTVPALAPEYVVALGPKCHVSCCDAATGQLRWGLDLVRQFGSTVPPWYAGQCPLISEGRAILAPGGKDALLLAVDCESGEIVWQTPNPHGWRMTHSSVMPMEFAGLQMYVYCASGGVVGVSAENGALLWETSNWRISIANVPSPVVMDQGRIFLCGGYDAGSLMLQLKVKGDQLTAESVYRLEPKVFGATQQTPIYYQGHLYGIRADGYFVCLDPEGKIQWSSQPNHKFGLGSYLLVDSMIFVLNDKGKMTVIQATPDGYAPLAEAQVLTGRESWAPMSIAGGLLILRDLTHMVCLNVGR